MLDRVREAIFSTLAPRLEDAFVLDLFAGSGGLSFESLSRGARHARPIESDRKAFAFLKRNLESLGVEDRADPVRADALDPRAWGGEPADIAFLDPPYPWLKKQKERCAIFEGVRILLTGAVAPTGLIVFHAPRNAVSAGEFGKGLELSERIYGSNSIWYVERGEDWSRPERSDDG
jgi:16S rRNA (guanine966-N2)-methyltransferase